MTASLEAEGIDVRALARLDKVPSGLAMITVDGSGENIITVAPGANGRVGEAQVDSAVGTPYDALVISAEIPVAAVRLALARAPRGVTCVLNLAPAPPAAAAIVAGGVDWLVVNESEAAAVLGQPVRGMDEARKAAVALVAAGARNAVVTAGPHGAAMAGAALAGPGSLGTGGQGGARAEGGAGAQGKADGSGSDVLSAPVFKVDAVDSVGAGDTFVGAFAVALAAGVRPFDAVVAASAAGATAVTRHGAQAGMPRPADVLAATGTAWPLA
jgi:ribokinase